MFYKTNNGGFILLHQQEYQDYEIYANWVRKEELERWV